MNKLILTAEVLETKHLTTSQNKAYIGVKLKSVVDTTTLYINGSIFSKYALKEGTKIDDLKHAKVIVEGKLNAYKKQDNTVGYSILINYLRVLEYKKYEPIKYHEHNIKDEPPIKQYQPTEHIKVKADNTEVIEWD